MVAQHVAGDGDGATFDTQGRRASVRGQEVIQDRGETGPLVADISPMTEHLDRCLRIAVAEHQRDARMRASDIGRQDRTLRGCDMCDDWLVDQLPHEYPVRGSDRARDEIVVVARKDPWSLSRA